MSDINTKGRHMNPKRKSLGLLLFIISVTITLLGLFFTPDFVAKYLKKVDVLPDYTVTKVLYYQLYSVIAGCILFIISVYFYNKKYLKYVMVPAVVILFLLIYRVHINVLYPNNIFMKTSELIKPLNVLLGKDIVLSDYKPKSALVVKNRKILKAKYPVIDFHFHLKSMKNINADELVKAMDACGIEKIVNLDGMPRYFDKYTKEFKEKYPDRFIMFSVFRFWELNKPNFPENYLNELDNIVKMGAKGLKVYKGFGLDLIDNSGKLVPVDDPRFDPIWEKAASMKLPVLMHSTDPSPFWTPTDGFNERYEELRDYPKWSYYYNPNYPPKKTILKQTENLIKKHPKTIFVMAHMGCIPEDLAYVAYLMDTYPNYYVDIAAVIAELGRQPYTARKFFVKYQDRILFGSDGGYGLNLKGLWPPERLFRTYFEFMETSNEYFEYQLWGVHNQGRWYIYGIDLPDTVLEKIYYKNAEKILFQKSGKSLASKFQS